MPIGIGDADLVVRALSGDRRAEDALYRRHARRIAGLVARLLGSYEDVEDVVHDAFVAAFEQLDQLRDPEAFRSWLQRIAVLKVRRVIRRRRMRRRLGFSTEEPLTLEAMATREIGPDKRTELALIDDVLQRMTPDLRIAWMLRFVEGYRIREVAEITGVSMATAKRRLQSAQQRIQSVVEVPEVDDE